jgi:hypothetical protein
MQRSITTQNKEIEFQAEDLLERAGGRTPDFASNKYVKYTSESPNFP